MIMIVIISLLLSCSSRSNLVAVHKMKLDSGVVSKICSLELKFYQDMDRRDPEDSRDVQGIYQCLIEYLDQIGIETKFSDGKDILMEVVTLFLNNGDVDDVLSYLFKGFFKISASSKVAWQIDWINNSLLNKDIKGNNILHYLIEHNLEKTAITMYEMDLSNFNEALLSQNDEGYSPLGLSIVKQRWTFFSKFTKLTKLHLSLEEKASTFNALKQLHASSVDKLGNNALMLAVICGWDQAVKEMLTSGDSTLGELVSLDYENHQGSNAFYEMIKRNISTRIIKLAIDKSYDIKDEIPMGIAACLRNKQLVGFLYGAGFDYSSSKKEKAKSIAKHVAKIVLYASGIAVDKFLTGAMAIGNPVVSSLHSAEQALDEWKEGSSESNHSIDKILNAKFIEESIGGYNWLHHVKILYRDTQHVPPKIVRRVKSFVNDLEKKMPEKLEFNKYTSAKIRVEKYSADVRKKLNFEPIRITDLEDEVNNIMRLFLQITDNLYDNLDNLIQQVDNWFQSVGKVKKEFARISNY